MLSGNIVLLLLASYSQHAVAQKAQMFNSAAAERAWNKLDRVDSQGGAAVKQWCGVAGMDDSACADTFVSGDASVSFAARQAGVNCMNTIETEQKQTAALLGMLHVDTSKFSRYASGASVPKWKKMGDTDTYTRNDASPSDVAKAMERASKIGLKEGENVAVGLKMSMGFFLGLLGSSVGARLGGAGAAGAGGPIGGLSAFPWPPNEQEFKDGYAKAKAVEAYNDPLAYLKDSELTGTCTYGSPECRDADGKPYYNKNYDQEKGSDPGPEHVSFDTVDPLDTDPIIDNIDNPGAESNNDDIQGTIEVDPNIIDPDQFLKQCVEKETRRITAIVGVMHTADDASSPPLTEEEERAQAEEQLRLGICDKEVLGEEKCRKWKQQLHTEAGDIDFQVSAAEALVRQAQACPSEQVTEESLLNPSPCQKAKQDIFKRYVLDPVWNQVAESMFDRVRKKMDSVVPIHFGDISVPKGVQVATESKPGFRAPITVHAVATPGSRPDPPAAGVPDPGKIGGNIPGFELGPDLRITLKPPPTGRNRPKVTPVSEKKIVVVVTGIPGLLGHQPPRSTVTITLGGTGPNLHDEL